MMSEAAVLILIAPLAAFIIVSLLPQKKSGWAGWIALLGIAISFLLSLQLFSVVRQSDFHGHEATLAWISLSHLTFDLGLIVDRLSVLMLLVVTGVGSLIFLYSIEYMHEDTGFKRYFAGLSLFAFSMIGIVLSNNLIQLFIFWELVGLSSYLLIGHWYEKPEAADAGKKAFLTNRVGDFGFILGILILWMMSGPLGTRTLHMGSLETVLGQLIQVAPDQLSLLTTGLLLVFLGVMGKSAQFPLHVWLPDAMEGPTPVSALIHAATMVAAGVYLLARLFPLYTLSPQALEIIAYLGGFTALFAATQAVVQIDIKRILAYSTLSQLGYMVMAVGLGSASIGMYHLTTHAFFKALLFLGAGSIIHAMHDQNIFNMGELLKKMPVTSITFLIGTYALMGFWPSSGFFSKDEILALALGQNQFLFILSAVTVFLTALYMSRLVIVAILGKSKSKKKLHESDFKMMIPLIILSLFALISGFLGLEHFLHELEIHHAKTNSVIVIIATGLGVLGIATAYAFYQLKEKQRSAFRTSVSWIVKLLERRYYMDDLYNWVLNYIQQPLARFLSWFEKTVVVEGVVNHTALAVQKAGDYSRRMQSGNLQNYVTVFLTGVVVFIYFFSTRG